MLFVSGIFFCACLIILCWGHISVQAELVRRNPLISFNSIATRMAVDPFIWSDEAPRGLRQRYILCSACMPIGLLCFAYATSHSPSHPERHFTYALIGVLSAVVTGVSLLIKVMRYGF
jgi:hypothetical protein